MYFNLEMCLDSLRPRPISARPTTTRSPQAHLNINNFMEACFTEASGQPLRQGQIHIDLQNFLHEHRRALIELPRDHGKTMQMAGRLIWELGIDPSLRIKLVCSSQAIAADRGHFLLTALRTNAAVRRCFPNLRLDYPRSAGRFSVVRPANVIGPSVTAIGVGATLTGMRADLLVCDDIVDMRAISSRNERERIKKYFRDNLMNLLEPDGRCWCLFTPWHQDDLNSELKGNRMFAHFRKAIDDKLTPVWPERWTHEHLKQRREEIGTISFARGYRLMPMSAEEQLIKPEWVQFWDEPRPSSTTVLAVDPAVSAKARADSSALVTLGRDDLNRIRCLEAVARRVTAPELLMMIDDADQRHKPDVILFESNAAFKGICDLLTRHARFGPKIKGIRQTKEKAARIHEFSITIENGSFRLLGGKKQVDPSQQALFDEMITFPGGDHDDLVDAAAMGTHWLLNVKEPRIF